MNNGEFFLADAIEVIEEVLASGGEFRMYPKGTSMLPLIVQKKDSVVLKRNFDVPAKRHDIAFYRRDNGQFVLHRVMKICDDGTYTMCGDNQLALEKGIRAEQIIAYVDTVYSDKDKVKTKGLKYSFYLFWWTKMPARRVCFFLRRVRNRAARIFRSIFPKHS